MCAWIGRVGIIRSVFLPLAGSEKGVIRSVQANHAGQYVLSGLIVPRSKAAVNALPNCSAEAGQGVLSPLTGAGLPTRQVPRPWRGQVDEAVAQLESYRPECRNEEKLDEVINYLTARKPYIVNYKERRANRIYIGSGHAERVNDLIVSRRQKHEMRLQWDPKTPRVNYIVVSGEVPAEWRIYLRV